MIDLFVQDNNLDYGSYCSNGGVCSYDLDNNQLNCACKEGFKGDRCQETLNNNCFINPCKYGACTSTTTSFKCTCNPGWEGDVCDKQTKVNIEDHCVTNNTESVKYSYADNRWNWVILFLLQNLISIILKFFTDMCAYVSMASRATTAVSTLTTARTWTKSNVAEMVANVLTRWAPTSARVQMSTTACSASWKRKDVPWVHVFMVRM